MSNKLKREEVEPIAAELRKILTHDGLEKLILSHGAYREQCETQEQLLKNHAEIDRINAKLVAGLTEQVESEKEYIKSVEAKFDAQCELSDGMIALMDTQQKEILALSQTEIHSRALSQTDKHYAVECRSILVYVLERTERGDDFLRLWEVLPKDQKDIYNEEARKWLGKQPPHVDPELRKQMLPPPQRKGSDHA